MNQRLPTKDRFLIELNAFADELARLPRSVETTGLELRFAMLQAMARAQSREDGNGEGLFMSLEPN